MHNFRLKKIVLKKSENFGKVEKFENMNMKSIQHYERTVKNTILVLVVLGFFSYNCMIHKAKQSFVT